MNTRPPGTRACFPHHFMLLLIFSGACYYENKASEMPVSRYCCLSKQEVFMKHFEKRNGKIWLLSWVPFLELAENNKASPFDYLLKVSCGYASLFWFNWLVKKNVSLIAADLTLNMTLRLTLYTVGYEWREKCIYQFGKDMSHALYYKISQGVAKLY